MAWLFIIFCIILLVAVRILFKVWGPSVLNHYDNEGQVSTLGSHCLFCKIVVENNVSVYQDDRVYVFTDIYPKANVHLLVIPKRHIKNLFHLKKSDASLLKYMKEIGKKLVKDMKITNHK
jgi:galactose-1-phosphate uridylyltransferase